MKCNLNRWGKGTCVPKPSDCPSQVDFNKAWENMRKKREEQDKQLSNKNTK